MILLSISTNIEYRLEMKVNITVDRLYVIEYGRLVLFHMKYITTNIVRISRIEDSTTQCQA